MTNENLTPAGLEELFKKALEGDSYLHNPARVMGASSLHLPIRPAVYRSLYPDSRTSGAAILGNIFDAGVKGLLSRIVPNPELLCTGERFHMPIGETGMYLSGEQDIYYDGYIVDIKTKSSYVSPAALDTLYKNTLLQNSAYNLLRYAAGQPTRDKTLIVVVIRDYIEEFVHAGTTQKTPVHYHWQDLYDPISFYHNFLIPRAEKMLEYIGNLDYLNNSSKCSAEDLNIDESTVRVYRKESNLRHSKSFPDVRSAVPYLEEIIAKRRLKDPPPKVVQVDPYPQACTFCAGKPYCKQFEQLHGATYEQYKDAQYHSKSTNKSTEIPLSSIL